jgi:hypothetical protein
MSKGVDYRVPVVRVSATKPETELNKVVAALGISDSGARILVVDFLLSEYWTEQKKSIALTALYLVRLPAIKVCIFPANAVDTDLSMLGAANVDGWGAELPFPIFELGAPIPLQPVAIPKPWGQEIWYTGIERRGVAEVGSPDKKIPLPWLLAAAPQRLGLGDRTPILLKILDPLPEPVFGDLYFELHQQKQEVYVVTAVDERAWPDGNGAIRFGFDSALREQYGDDRRFLAEYFAAVRRYRLVRVKIDNLLDEIRRREGVGLNDPVAAVTLQSWLGEVPPALRDEEKQLRLAMERFTRLLPLSVGDVVKVPCLLPHSLQHGVRTVEFQTPVYERLILSFAQKVLTQAEWDTDTAAALIQLDPPPPAPFPVTQQGDGWVEQRIVSFDDFEVLRISLQPGARRELVVEQGYRLGMVVGGGLQLGGRSFGPDDATLLPGGLRADLQNRGSVTAYFLLAQPLAGAG